MRYGAKHAMWAPFSGAEPATGMPTYGEAKELGGLNESNDTLNFAEGSAYADNAEKIHLKEFTNGTIDTHELAVPFDLMAEILGTDADEGGLAYGGSDDAPFGGYGFIACYMDGNKKRTYGVIFYPKVQGSAASGNYKTKEDNITLEYDQIAFNILLPNCDKYKIEERFDTEEEAIAYLEGLFEGTSQVPGVAGSGVALGTLTVTSAASAETDGKTKLTVTEGKLAGTNIYKYRVGDHEEDVKYDQDCTAWTTWDGTAEITAATGTTLTLVECTKENKARAKGKCTVTAKAAA